MKYSFDVVQMRVGTTGGPIGLTECGAFLLSRPDSLLSRALEGSLAETRPLLDELAAARPLPVAEGATPAPRCSRALQALLDSSGGAPDEAGLTIAILEGTNLFSATLSRALDRPLADLVARIRDSRNIPQAVEKLPNATMLNRGRNLSYLASQGQLLPCHGRKREINALAEVLLQSLKHFPVLTGDAGVGKTAIVEGFAQWLLSPEAPERLRGRTVIDFSPSLFTAGNKYVGEVAKAVEMFIRNCRENPDVIVFIDEIHTLVGLGKAEGSHESVDQLLKPVLGRGDIMLIGATTSDEFAILERDQAFERRADQIRVEEPSETDAAAMLRSLGTRKLEVTHRIAIPDLFYDEAVRLSMRYMKHRRLPDKAVSLLDRACAIAALRGARELAAEDLSKAISALTGIDILDFSVSGGNWLDGVQRAVRERVIGQDEAIATMFRSLLKYFEHLKEARKPLGAFFLVGRPGCGKTHFAKILAKTMFGSEARLLRVDLNEFGAKESVSRLIGSPPGYVGHEQGGILTNFLKKYPLCVILLDEFEKSHDEIQNAIMGLIGEGRVTDGRGRTVDAQSAIVIMTSNIGSDEARTGHLFTGTADPDRVTQKIREKLRERYSTAFIDRLDEVLVFNDLSEADFARIVALELRDLAASLGRMGIALSWEESFCGQLAEIIARSDQGARALTRLLDDRVLYPLARAKADGGLREGDRIRLLGLEEATLAWRKES